MTTGTLALGLEGLSLPMRNQVRYSPVVRPVPAPVTATSTVSPGRIATCECCRAAHGAPGGRISTAM